MTSKLCQSTVTFIAQRKSKNCRTIESINPRCRWDTRMHIRKCRWNKLMPKRKALLEPAMVKKNHSKWKRKVCHDQPINLVKYKGMLISRHTVGSRVVWKTSKLMSGCINERGVPTTTRDGQHGWQHIVVLRKDGAIIQTYLLSASSQLDDMFSGGTLNAITPAQRVVVVTDDCVVYAQTGDGAES